MCPLMFLHLVNIAYHTGGNWFAPLSEAFTRREREPLLAARSGFIPKNTFSCPTLSNSGWQVSVQIHRSATRDT